MLTVICSQTRIVLCIFPVTNTEFKIVWISRWTFVDIIILFHSVTYNGIRFDHIYEHASYMVKWKFFCEIMLNVSDSAEVPLKSAMWVLWKCLKIMRILTSDPWTSGTHLLKASKRAEHSDSWDEGLAHFSQRVLLPWSPRRSLMKNLPWRRRN